jgi:hypothetical protein
MKQELNELKESIEQLRNEITELKLQMICNKQIIVYPYCHIPIGAEQVYREEYWKYPTYSTPLTTGG